MADASFSAVGNALSDVGRGIGGVLSDEAQRRQQDLAAQQEQNRLLLQQQQLALQGKQQEMTGQLGLARAQEEGRQFDVLREEHTADRAQQTVQQMRQAGFQEKQLSLQEEQMRFAHAELERSNPLVDFDKFVSAVAGHVEATQGPGSGTGAVHTGLGVAQVLFSGLAKSLPADPTTGARQIRYNQGVELLTALAPYIKARDPNALTPRDRQELINTTLGHMEKDTSYANVSFADRHVVATALVTNPEGLSTKLQEMEPQRKALEARLVNEYLHDHGGKEPTEQDKQQFVAQYSQAHQGTPPPADQAAWQGLPEWQTFRQQKLVATGGKMPDTSTRTKQIDPLVQDYLQRRTVDAARGLVTTPGLGTTGASPAGPVSAVPSEAWRAASPQLAQHSPTVRNTILATVDTAAGQYGVPPADVLGLIQVESQFNPRAQSPAGAQGLGQFMPGTAQQYRLADPYNIPDNITATAHKWADDLKKAGGDRRIAYGRYYNPNAPQKDIEAVIAAQDRFRAVLAQQTPAATPTALASAASPPAEQPTPSVSGRLGNAINRYAPWAGGLGRVFVGQ